MEYYLIRLGYRIRLRRSSLLAIAFSSSCTVGLYFFYLYLTYKFCFCLLLSFLCSPCNLLPNIHLLLGLLDGGFAFSLGYYLLGNGGAAFGLGLRLLLQRGFFVGKHGGSDILRYLFVAPGLLYYGVPGGVGVGLLIEGYALCVFGDALYGGNISSFYVAVCGLYGNNLRCIYFLGYLFP